MRRSLLLRRQGDLGFQRQSLLLPEPGDFGFHRPKAKDRPKVGGRRPKERQTRSRPKADGKRPQAKGPRKANKKKRRPNAESQRPRPRTDTLMRNTLQNIFRVSRVVVLALVRCLDQAKVQGPKEGQRNAKDPKAEGAKAQQQKIHKRPKAVGQGAGAFFSLCLSVLADPSMSCTCFQAFEEH